MYKNAIILRILRRPITIHKCMSFINYSLVSKDTITFKDHIEGEDIRHAEKIDEIKLSAHSVERWNTRVGPPQSLKQLETWFNKLLHIPQRINKISDGIGVVDSEIVFTYIKVHRSIVITTFYGRRSTNHTLYHMEELRRYNIFEQQEIDLEVGETIIAKQTLPSIPMIYMEFSGVKTEYRMQGYKIKGQDHPIFFVQHNPGGLKEIDLNKSDNGSINKSVLLALFLLRYKDFVWEYLQRNYGDRIEKLENRFSIIG